MRLNESCGRFGALYLACRMEVRRLVFSDDASGANDKVEDPL